MGYVQPSSLLSAVSSVQQARDFISIRQTPMAVGSNSSKKSSLLLAGPLVFRFVGSAHFEWVLQKAWFFLSMPRFGKTWFSFICGFPDSGEDSPGRRCLRSPVGLPLCWCSVVSLFLSFFSGGGGMARTTLWMVAKSGHGRLLFVGIYRGAIISVFLRWCEVDFVHPQYDCSIGFPHTAFER